MNNAIGKIISRTMDEILAENKSLKAQLAEANQRGEELEAILREAREYIWQEYIGTFDCCSCSGTEVTLEPESVRDLIDELSFDAIQKEANQIKRIDAVLGQRARAVMEKK